MSLIRVVAPNAEPVSLAEAKAQCRVEHDVEDTLFTRWIATAREQTEHLLCRALITQQWERVLDAFPTADAPGVELGMPPVQSIVSVKYADPQGQEQILASTAYTLDTDTSPGWLLPAYGSDWPATLDTANAVRVRFICGYGPVQAAVPEGVRSYILAHVHHWYCNRGAVSDKRLEPVPYLERLLDPYRSWL